MHVIIHICCVDTVYCASGHRNALRIVRRVLVMMQLHNVAAATGFAGDPDLDAPS